MTPSTPEIPPEVLNLAAREREVATVVYTHGAPTAKYVLSCLSAELSSGAVRSMLVRLVKKGILRRAWGKRGRSQEFIYMPAITPETVRRNALQLLADRYFDGSLLSVAQTVLALLDEHQSTTAQARNQPRPDGRGKPVAQVDLAA